MQHAVGPATLGLTALIIVASACFLRSASAGHGRDSIADSHSIPPDTVERWAAPYRTWHYYPRLVLTAELEGELGFRMVDGPNVFRHNGQWQMFYFGFDGTGYQACRAVSDDLLHWEGRGLVMSYGKAGAFDYGGVAFTGPLYDSIDVRRPPQLAQWNGRYWLLYGCYPEQGGYELGSGGQGLAWSQDGLQWHRASRTTPVLSIDGASAWEARVIYSPCVLRHEGMFWNFYNARGLTNREQIGLARSADLKTWQRFEGNPLLGNTPGGYDELLAADPEIYRDGDHWVMIYFGASRNSPDSTLHAHTLIAFSRDLLHWTPHPEPILRAGGHPTGLDSTHAHNVSLVYNPDNHTRYMFYCAVGAQGRGIALVTNRPLPGTEAE